MDSVDESTRSALYSALYCAYNQLITVCPDSIDYSLHVKDGATLLTVKFGELVWLCKILEAASEKYKANYKVTNFDYSDKSVGNFKRFYELLNLCEITVPSLSTVQQYVHDPFTNEAIEFFTSLLTDLTTIFEEVTIKPKDKRNAAMALANGLPPTAPTPQRAKYARSAVLSPSGTRTLSSSSSVVGTTSLSSSSTPSLGSPNQASLLRYGNSTSNRNTPLRPVSDTPNVPSSIPRSMTKTSYTHSATTAQENGLIEPPTPSRSSGNGSFLGGALSFFADKAMSLTTGMTTADVDRLSQDKKTLEETLQRFILRAQEADRKERMWESLLARQENDAKQKEEKLLAENAKQARQLNELKQSIDQIRMGADEATRTALVKREELFNRLDNELSTTLQEKHTLQNKVIELEASLNEARNANERTYNEYTQQIQHLTTKITDISENRGKIEADNVRYMNELNTLKNEYQEKLDQLNNDGTGKLQQMTDKINQLQSQLEMLQNFNQQLQTNLSSQHSSRTEIEAAYTTMNQRYCTLQDQHQTTLHQASTALTGIRTFRTDMNTFRTDMANQFTATLQDFSIQTMVLTKRIKHAEKDAEEAKKRYHHEQAERRNLHNKLSELRGNIRVFARIRPFLSKENETVPIVTATGNQELVVAESVPEGGLSINSKGRVLESKTYEFDRVFGAESTQEQVFDEISPMVTSALDGYHSCIFAYGQTGSGKTFTMEGPVHNRGVYFRALADLFSQIKERCTSNEWSYAVRVSMVEIYNECVVDLLGDKPTSSYDGFMEDDSNITSNTNNASSFGSTNSSATKAFLEIKQGPNGNYLPDAHVVEVTTQAEVEALMVQGAHNRSVGRTNANEHSSRSHSLLMLEIVGKNSVSNATSNGKLVLVDLAGSERVSKTGATGQRLEEAKNINQSLSALNSVIHALQIKQKHIPFRDSKLTYLLADSLGKDNKTLMIVQVSPSAYSRGETLCSLDFASRARKVELGKAVKHGDSGELLRSKNEIKRLQELSTKSTEEIETLKQQLQTYIDNERSTQAKYTEAMNKVSKLETELATTNAALAKKTKVTAVDSNEMEAIQAEIASVMAENQALKEEIDNQKLKMETAVKEAVKQTTQSTKAVTEKETVVAIKKAVDEANEKARNAQTEAVKRAVAEAQREKENRTNTELETLRKRIRDLQASLERADAKTKEEIQAAKRTWEREKIKNARTTSGSTTSTTGSKTGTVNGNGKNGTVTNGTNSRKQSLVTGTANGSSTNANTNFNSTTSSFASSSLNLNGSGYLPDNFSVTNENMVEHATDTNPHDTNSVADQSSIDDDDTFDGKDDNEMVPDNQGSLSRVPTDEVTETIQATRALLDEIKSQMNNTEYVNDNNNDDDNYANPSTANTNDSFTGSTNASLDASAIIHSMLSTGTKNPKNTLSSLTGVTSAVKLPIQYVQSPFDQQQQQQINTSTVSKGSSIANATPGNEMNASYLLFHDTILPTPSEVTATTPPQSTNTTTNGSFMQTPATVLAASYFASPDLLMFPNKSFVSQNDIVNHAVTNTTPSSSTTIDSVVSLLDLPPSQTETGEQPYTSPVLTTTTTGFALEDNGMNMTPMVKSLSNSFLNRSTTSSKRTPVATETLPVPSPTPSFDEKTDEEIEQEASEEFQLAELNASNLATNNTTPSANDNSVILSGKKRNRGGTPFKTKEMIVSTPIDGWSTATPTVETNTEDNENNDETNTSTIVPLASSVIIVSRTDTESTTAGTTEVVVNTNDDGTFQYGSRERARLLGIPSPKPVGILKRKKVSNDKAVTNTTVATNDTTAKTEAEDGTIVTRGRRRNVALISPESSTVHMIKAEAEADATNKPNETDNVPIPPPVTLRSSSRSTTSASPGPNKSRSSTFSTATTTTSTTGTGTLSRSGSASKLSTVSSRLSDKVTTLSYSAVLPRTVSNNTLTEQSGNTDTFVASTSGTTSTATSTTPSKNTIVSNKRGAIVAAVATLPEAQKKSKTTGTISSASVTNSTTLATGTSTASVTAGPARVKVDKENNGSVTTARKVVNGTSATVTTMKGGATRVAVSNNSTHGARRI